MDEKCSTFLATITFKGELKIARRFKIESVRVRKLVREVPRYRAHMVELGTLTEASHEEYEDAADYFSGLV